MRMMRWQQVLFIGIVLVLITSSAAAATHPPVSGTTERWIGTQAFVISDLRQTTYLTSRITRLVQDVTLRNPTKTDSDGFNVALTADDARQLGQIYVEMSNGDIRNVELGATHEDIQLYHIPIPLKSGDHATYRLTCLFGRQHTPRLAALPFMVNICPFSTELLLGRRRLLIS